MWERDILPGLTGHQPPKIKPEWASEESFLGDALSERARDRIPMKALSLYPYALRLWSQAVSRYRLEGNSHPWRKPSRFPRPGSSPAGEAKVR